MDAIIESAFGTDAPTADARAAALALLLSDAEGARSAARLFGDRLGWMSAVLVCSDWGALPRLDRRLRELGLALEGAPREKFRRWANAVFLRSASSLHTGALALSTLSEGGIEAAAFKGVAAVATLCHGPKDRTLGDTDVLVRERDLQGAVAALEGSGFRLAAGRTLADHIEFTRKYPNVGNRALSMFATNGGEIDLHWHLGRVDVGRVLTAGRWADLYGLKVRIVCDRHGFLLVVHHLLRNGFELDRAVRDLVDSQGWLDVVLQRGAMEPLVQEALAWGLAAPALATMQILERFDPAGPGAASASEFRSRIARADQRAADALTACFFLQTTGGWNADTVRTLDAKAFVQFVRRTLWGRALYTPPVNIQHSGSPGRRSLRQRLRQFGRALPRTRWRLVLAMKRAQDAAFTSEAGLS